MPFDVSQSQDSHLRFSSSIVDVDCQFNVPSGEIRAHF